MKKILLLFAFIGLSFLSYSQELYLGKNMDEIKSISNINGIDHFYGRKCLNSEIDSNTRDIFVFNENNICIEYIRIVKNTDISDIEQYLHNYYKIREYCYEDYSSGLIAMVNPLTDNLFQIRIKKNRL
jgi:hypothetical protein